MIVEQWRALSAPFFLMILTVVAPVFASASGERRSVHIGVVLETETLLGKMWLTSINMSVDEFYTNHCDCNTRLAIHPRDSNGTAIGAASAALELLVEVGVDAIIGTESSSQAVFASDLAAKAKVPLVSFTATSPSLTSRGNPFFVRTTLSDAAQVSAIASLVRRFPWREVALICEDSEFGSGIVPYLTFALQDVGAPVTHRCLVHPSANADEVRQELEKLRDIRTRVFVVHMNATLGSMLFSEAKKLQLMGNDSAWIMTTGITTQLESKEPEALRDGSMVGVLGLRPYMAARNEFTQRWEDAFRKLYPEEAVPKPDVFNLWAYDTVRALAEAAEDVDGTTKSIVWGSGGGRNGSTSLMELGVSMAGPKLLESLLKTNFSDGMSGKVRLVDGQLQASMFELVNVVQNRSIMVVGNWTSPKFRWDYGEVKVDIENVTWPGTSSEIPRGWEWLGKTLRIRVPLVKGFRDSAHVGKDDSGSNKTVKGFCIKVFEAAIRKLPYNVSYEYVDGEPSGTYDDLIRQLSLDCRKRKFDAVVGDTTIWYNRSPHADFTTPFTESGTVMLVAIKEEPQHLWGFLDPMTHELWITTAAAFVLTGFVVWLLEHRINQAFMGTSLHQLGTVFYFSFSTMVFAHKEKMSSNLSRVVVIVWVFIVLVLTSSYTASLSSMLTSQQLKPTYTDASDLRHKDEKVGYRRDSIVKELLTDLGFKESNLKPLESPEEYAEELSKGSHDGGVAAIFDEVPYVRFFLSKYPSRYTVVGHPYRTDGFGFAFPRGSPLARDISRKILEVREGSEIFEFKEELYGDMANDASLSSSGNQDAYSVTSKLSFKRFLGLFLITGTTSTACLLLHLFICYWQNRHEVDGDDAGNQSIWDQITIIVTKLHDRKDPVVGTTPTRNLTDDVPSSSSPRINFTPLSPSSFSYHTYQDPDIEECEETPHLEQHNPDLDQTIHEENHSNVRMVGVSTNAL